VDPARDEYKKTLQQYMGLNEANTLLTELQLNLGQVKKLPPAIDQTLFFSDLKFKWDQNSKSFKSYGKIGVGALNKNMVNKYVDGKVEIVKRRGANRITIYLETNSGEWFWFSYSNGIMRTVSSVADYNNIINKLKDKDRKLDAPGVSYVYYFGSEAMKDEFLRNFNRSDVVEDDVIVTPDDNNNNTNTNPNSNTEEPPADDDK
jgi:hypothetical protein